MFLHTCATYSQIPSNKVPCLVIYVKTVKTVYKNVWNFFQKPSETGLCQDKYTYTYPGFMYSMFTSVLVGGGVTDLDPA